MPPRKRTPEPEPEGPRKFEERWPFMRDVTLFLAGLGGVVHETVARDLERPFLLLAFAAMMGLPAFFPAPKVGA